MCILKEDARVIVINKSFIITPSPQKKREGVEMVKVPIASEEEWKQIAFDQFGLEVRHDKVYDNLRLYRAS
jgi:hypothetical protein